MGTGANSGKGAFANHKGSGTETHAEHMQAELATGEAGDEQDPFEGLTTKETAALQAQMGNKPLIDKPYSEMTGKEKAFMTFEDPTVNAAAGVISIVITSMILVSTSCFIAETMPELEYQGSVSDTCETPPCGVHPDTWAMIEL
jgi:hypothetical protein